MIGLERFSLYQNEDELKADLEQTNLVNCLSWNFLIQRDRKGEDGKLTDKFMNEMLFYAVKEEEPWEGLNCFIYDYAASTVCSSMPTFSRRRVCGL